LSEEASRKYLVSILVLVDVALEQILAWAQAGITDGFNPCSRGCRSGTDRVCIETRHPWGFQSLFSWMSLWNLTGVGIIPAPRGGFNPCSRGCRSGTVFRQLFRERLKIVSILVLVDVALEHFPFRDFRWCRRGFNPCSRGCRSGTRVPGGEVWMLEAVSILVLVDVALERDGLIEIRPEDLGFNPCSRGCRSGTTTTCSL